MKNLAVVRGGTGCGKTTFAAALAARLARSGIHTLLLSPDSHIPAFGLWVPKGEPPFSLGRLLESAAPEESVLASAVYIPHGLKENLGLLGYLANEAADRYNPPIEDRASAFLRLAAGLAEQVVVDGTVYGDVLTAAAVKAASLQFRLLEPDPRGFLSITSSPPEKSGGKTFWIACPHGTDDPTEETEKRLHLSFSAALPRIPEAHTKLTEGRLFAPYRDRQYGAAVELAARAVREGTV